MNELNAKFQQTLADLRGGQISAVLTRSADLLLVAAVATMVGLMVVPLPTWLLDLFLSVNITIALVIVMVSIYIPHAIQLASYPTLLLITTLYRLSLDISTTRLILLQANAGEVVDSFGKFVVQGNFVVGAVIFLIITLVQFLVITKGAERVAEVAARFTLDAIPGKQMSIDADLRAGTITFEQARQRREELSRESQFYGAMDGAMKFVKGDAIAGIIITLINIVAGLIIGVAMNRMSAGDAAQTYSVLTIGSGLVSQIPALLISISAGLVVTRVAGSDSKNSNLGSQVMGQVIAQPKAIGVAAALMLLLALIPGLPKIPFFILAGVVGTVAFQLLKAQQKEVAGETKPELKEAQVAMPEVLATVPVMLRAGSGLGAFLSPQTIEGQQFVEKMNQIRNSLYMEVGVLYPPVQVSIDPTVAPNSFQIYLKETPAFSTEVRPDCVLVGEPAANIAIFGLKGQPGLNPLNGRPATWLSVAVAEQASAAGLTAWKPAEVIQLHLTMFLRRNGAEFVGLQEVHSMVERLKQIYPALVEQTIPKPISMPLLTDVLKRLATESVSIRDLKSILESLADWGRTDEDPASLTEFVRSDMRRRLCFQLSRGKAQLHFYSLDPKYEDMFRLSIRKSAGGGQSFAMGSDALDAVLGAAHRAFANRPSTAQPPVILTTRDIRRFVRHVIGSQYPDVSVISNDQLTAEIELSPLGMLA